MSKHLFGLVVTHHGTAANNRGETEGNITTLQKILWQGEVHTTVSAEAIRWAIRWYWQRRAGEEVLNRRWKEQDEKGKPKEKPSHEWQDHEFKEWQRFMDDDVLGFMSAEAAREEANVAEGAAAEVKGARKRGQLRSRRARFEVTRAISLSPYAGDITFNAASVGATPSASRTGRDPVPYGTEVHATRYQYAFGLTPEELHDKRRALDVVDGIVSLSEVGGNQARFLFDFSPESIIFRWTDDFAPRMLYGFDLDAEGQLTAGKVVDRVEAGDIDPNELIVGGVIARLKDGEDLKEKGATVTSGIKDAEKEIKKRIKHDLKIE